MGIRKECRDCHRKFTKLNKCRDGIERCGICMKKRVTNKWYVPPKKGKFQNQVIGKFTITDKEKNLLHKQFMNQGLGTIQAWNKVNHHVNMLRYMRRKNNWIKSMERRKEMDKKWQPEKRKEFLKGLNIK